MSRSFRFILPAAAVATTVIASMAVAATPDGSAAPSGGYVPGHVLVSYRDGVTADRQQSDEHAAGATRIGVNEALGVVTLKVPAAAEQHVVDAFNRSGDAAYAELDGVAHAAGATGGGVTPNDTYWSQQWGPAKVNAPAVWSTTTGSSSVLVADIDTGIDLTHPDLQGKSVAGYDFVSNDSTPSDDNGHGTATASIIAATTNNNTGIAGMCWQCKIMPLKALDANGSGSYSAIANAVTWAADHGAQIINMSLGGSSASTTLHNALSYAANKGVLMIAAAGNNGTTAYNYPGAYSETLSVAATTSTDKLYSWSSYGSWVNVAAPGCDYATDVGGGYVSNFCGTSAATPVVSGAAALLKSAQPGATRTEIMSTFENTASNIGAAVQYGRIDASAALAALGTSAPAPAPAPAPATGSSTVVYGSNLNNGNPTRNYSITTGTGTLAASLTFSKNATMTIALKDPSGTVLTQSSGGSGVKISSSVGAGTYTVVVSGAPHVSYTLTITYPNP